MTTSNSERERANRLMAMGQMAANLAHEIRNPLGSMELYCSLLKKDLRETPATLDLAEQIHQGIRRLDRIISNCLQFTRDTIPKRKRFSGGKSLVVDAITYLRAEAEANAVEIRLLTDRDNGMIEVDPYLINQVIMNLGRNAIEASGLNSDASKRIVTIESIAEHGRWILTFSDSGPGIPVEDRERIFDPFFTTKTGGTGLGLAVVHSIVSAHNGTIQLQSVSPNGTKVIVEIGFEENQRKESIVTVSQECGGLE